VLERDDPQVMIHYGTELEDHRRREELGTSGPFDTLNGRELVEQRQARATVGLDTGELDAEIARRVREDPGAWGWIGRAMAFISQHCL
jgi:hypothetical protein